MGALQNAGLPISPTTIAAPAFVDIAYPGPTIVTAKKESGVQTAVAIVIAHPANDGKVILINSGTNANIICNNANGTTLWTVTPANINAAATDIVAPFLDDVEGYLYCIGWNNAGNTIYPAKINYNTGAVTNIVTSTTLTGLKSGTVAQNYFTRRAAYGSGDLTIWMVHANSAQKVSISTNTGFVTSGPTQLTVGGANLALNSPAGLFVPSDESYYASFALTSGSYNGPPGTNPFFILMRASLASRVSTPSLTLGFQLNYNAVASGLSTMVNGISSVVPTGNGILKLTSNSALSSTQNNNNGLYVTSASFEAWVNRVYNALVG